MVAPRIREPDSAPRLITARASRFDRIYHQTIIRLALVMVATTPSELMMTGGPQVARSISDRAARECVSCEDATPKIEN